MASSATDDPLPPFLSTPAGLVLDGGLATELERQGFDLAHPLWSARLLRERPQAIGSVHRAYLDAGADCITTASYQATVEGFRRAGATTAEAEGLLRLSVSLVKAVRHAFWTDSDRDPARLRPLVAASLGPYGACLADGSEYTGRVRSRRTRARGLPPRADEHSPGGRTRRAGLQDHPLTDTQYRIVQFNGSVRWIHDRSFPVLDETNGAVLRTIGIAADITERRQVGEALKDSEERLRLSLSAAKQGLYDLNVQTGDAVVNGDYSGMLGYDPETFVETNQAWIERLHPDDVALTSQTYLDYVNGLIPEYRVEFRQRTKDSNWKWILSLGRWVEYDASGKPLRLLGTHTDITEIKQAQIELQKRASRLALINDVSREIAGVLDIQAVLDQSAPFVGRESQRL